MLGQIHQIFEGLWDDIILYCILVTIFVVFRFLLRKDILKKEHTKDIPKSFKKELGIYLILFAISVIYITSLFFDIELLAKMVRFGFLVLVLLTISLVLNRQILIFYGKEVEVSGEKYFRKGYEASIFLLALYIILFFTGVFFCIKIFELDSIFEIGGLWAGILAFLGFTAPVWATDMIAGIILLGSKNFEIGQVYYIAEGKMYVWIKSISLTEVKCIDLRFGHPIIYRPHEFRSLTVTNLSQGITHKTGRIIREIILHVDYSVAKDTVEKLCFESLDALLVEHFGKDARNYFGESPYRSLEVSEFGDYAVEYKFFYSIDSAFYIFKAERLLNSYLLRNQQEKKIFFKTPNLISIEKT